MSPRRAALGPVALGVAALLALAHLARVLVAGPGGPDPRHLALGAVAAVVAVLAARRPRERERTAWRLVAGALVAWLVADGAVTAGLSPGTPIVAPHVTDLGYVAFYWLLLAGFWKILRHRVPRISRVEYVDAVAVGCAVSGVVASVAMNALVPPPGGTLGLAVWLPLVVGNPLLLGVSVCALVTAGRGADRGLVALSLGGALFALVDVFYARSVLAGTWAPGGALDAGWWLALLALALAVLLTGRRPVPMEPSGRGTGDLVPVVAGALSLLLLVVTPAGTSLPVLNGVGGLAAVMVRLLFTAAENRRLLAASRDEARTDALTGLGNRRALLATLEARLPAGADAPPFVLALLDLDGFKAFNDTFGHPAGDALLERVAGRLAAAAAPRGHVFRLGGDEFCALLELRAQDGVLHGRLDAAGLDGVADDFAAPLVAAARTVREGVVVSASAGAVLLPARAAGVEAALQAADERLYAAKRARVAVA